MVNSPVLPGIIAAGIGILSGLGVGGGSLMMLWLTMIENVPLRTAGLINLMYFIPSALVSSLFRIKHIRQDLNIILPSALAGIATSLLCSDLSEKIEIPVLRQVFGILLLITGIRELFYRPREFR